MASGASLSLENLTLQGGLAECIWNAHPSRPPLDGGGAIYNLGTLVLSGVTVQNNSAVGPRATTDNPNGINGGGAGVFSLGDSVTLRGAPSSKTTRPSAAKAPVVGTAVTLSAGGCMLPVVLSP